MAESGIQKGDPDEVQGNKCPVDTYLARGRIPAIAGAVCRTVNAMTEVIAATKGELKKGIIERVLFPLTESGFTYGQNPKSFLT